MRTLLEVIFWLSAGLLVYSQLGYPLLLALFARPAGDAPQLDDDRLPNVTLIVAAYAEAAVIEQKVANALALDYPTERLQLIVACDGSPDETPALARAAGAHLVLELDHGGKMAAQNAAVEQASGELIAFSDANTIWEPEALRRLVEALAAPGVDYACGRVAFVNESGDNQEGLYWRYEMWLRAHESALASVTAGNGAIYAVDPAAYRRIMPETGHDLTLPFNVVKNGGRAIDVAAARASETMVPSISGEFRRKRRMMSFTWPIVLGGGMLRPGGYGLRYSWMILSHRVLRYSAPFLHLAALLTSALLAAGSTLYLVLLVLQLALVLAALLAGVLRLRPFLIARYYILTTAAVLLGLYDYLRKGTRQILDEGWTPPEGTR
jgi:cellulose synthase/poly-beta-1,6-N-acetylglucosamine synthase-like glycosyltransferase